MPRHDGEVVPKGHFNVKCNTGGENSGDQEKGTGALWELETEPGPSVPAQSRISTEESLSQAFRDRFLLGVREFHVYAFPGWILVGLPTGFGSSLHLTSCCRSPMCFFSSQSLHQHSHCFFFCLTPTQDFPSGWWFFTGQQQAAK